MTTIVDDYLVGNHPCGLGVTFNHAVWQMALARAKGNRSYVNITKPNNPYREPARGSNVWEYYFGQEALTDESEPMPEAGLALSGHCDWTTEIQQAIRPIARQNIWLLEDIRDEVAAFREKHLTGKRTLCVHLRGTDKIEEYQPAKNRNVIAAVQASMARNNIETLFLQTDSANYANMMRRHFDCVVMLPLPRRETSMHHNPPTTRYEAGRWAVIDGWLGAACDHYLYTPSNFATISLIMGQHQSIERIPTGCCIDRFSPQVRQVLGLN